MPYNVAITWKKLLFQTQILLFCFFLHSCRFETGIRFRVRTCVHLGFSISSLIFSLIIFGKFFSMFGFYLYLVLYHFHSLSFHSLETSHFFTKLSLYYSNTSFRYLLSHAHTASGLLPSLLECSFFSLFFRSHCIFGASGRLRWWRWWKNFTRKSW